MRRSHQLTAGVVALALLTSGCYGPFLLTKKLHQWNGQVSDNKWVVELIFLGCAVFQIYGIATLADAILFNSLEFWTGDNPMAPSEAGAPSRRIVRGDTEAIITRVAGDQGDELLIEQFRRGERLPSLRLRRDSDSTVAFNDEGAVLFSARTLPDGRVVVSNPDGEPVTSYSSKQAERLLASLPQ